MTVLCILTFIGSGWGLLVSTMNFLGNDATVEQIEQYSDMMEQLDNGGGSSFISRMFESSREMMPYMKKISGTNLVFYILSLAGAFLMFRLKKTGFYLYSGAQIVMLFVAPLFAGFTAMTLVSLGGGAVLALVFIILYGLNLKYMK